MHICDTAYVLGTSESQIGVVDLLFILTYIVFRNVSLGFKASNVLQPNRLYCTGSQRNDFESE